MLVKVIVPPVAPFARKVPPCDTDAPAILISPPDLPLPKPDASSIAVSSSCTVWLPVRVIMPSSSVTRLAMIRPERLMEFTITSEAACADNVTMPPSASMLPVCVISASEVLDVTAPSGANCSSPSPNKSIVAASVAARVTCPRRARIWPECRISGDSKIAKPPSEMFCVPALSI